MIPQPLVERTKANLQWLAEKMPDKAFQYFEDEDGWDFWNYSNDGKHSSRNILVDCTKLPDKPDSFYIRTDYRQEFSNAIGRIMFEAFGIDVLCVPFFQNDEWTYWSLGKELESKTELSAQLESLNIRIEQEKNK